MGGHVCLTRRRETMSELAAGSNPRLSICATTKVSLLRSLTLLQYTRETHAHKRV